MNRRLLLAIRTVVVLLIVTGSGYGVRQYRKTKQAADLPVATAHKGEFLVLVRCRGELLARRSEQLAAPLDVPDLQIIWEAPSGAEVKKDRVVVRFDPSRTKQDLA